MLLQILEHGQRTSLPKNPSGIGIGMTGSAAGAADEAIPGDPVLRIDIAAARTLLGAVRRMDPGDGAESPEAYFDLCTRKICTLRPMRIRTWDGSEPPESLMRTIRET